MYFSGKERACSVALDTLSLVFCIRSNKKMGPKKQHMKRLAIYQLKHTSLLQFYHRKTYWKDEYRYKKFCFGEYQCASEPRKEQFPK